MVTLLSFRELFHRHAPGVLRAYISLRSCGLRRKSPRARRRIKAGTVGDRWGPSRGIGALLHDGRKTSLRRGKRRDCTGTVRPCQRRPEDPCARGMGRMAPMQSHPLSSSPVARSLPDPQLDEHRTVVGELIPHRSVLLAVGDVAEGGAINPGSTRRSTTR